MRTLSMALVLVVLLPVAVWGLGPGAPPTITFAGVYALTIGPNPSRLLAVLELEVPGGTAPVNIQSVTVSVPGGGTFPLAFERNDLYPLPSYSTNLNATGVLGFPAGTYTFTVTDTAGGVSTATDTLGATTGLSAPTSIALSGLTPVAAAAGSLKLLNLATTPTPTLSWTAVSGAATHRVRVFGGFGDRALFSKYTRDGTTTNITLPAGVMAPGRRYVVRVEAYDHVNGFDCTPQPCTHMDPNARSRDDIEVITQGPAIFLTFGQGPYTAGQTLDVTARIYNTGPAVKVNANAWIGLPTGAVIPILSLPNLAIPNSTANPTGPNDFYSGSIGFSYMFTGGEPSGNYVVGLRLTDPDTNETVALATRTFAK